MANRKYIVGNWKMNGLKQDLDQIAAIASHAAGTPSVDVAICTPATLIAPAVEKAGAMPVGGQDCHANEHGAHTGCISAEMLKEAGAGLTIVGHSERRADQGETDADIKGKAEAAHRAGLTAILCVGETEAERDAGKAVEIVCGQLSNGFPEGAAPDWLAIAYEPVWAIGTGRVPVADDVAEIHAAIRKALGDLSGDNAAAYRILYGGSMKGSNAAELLSIDNVDGGLVGGASLTGEAFTPIIDAAAAL